MRDNIGGARLNNAHSTPHEHKTLQKAWRDPKILRPCQSSDAHERGVGQGILADRARTDEALRGHPIAMCCGLACSRVRQGCLVVTSTSAHFWTSSKPLTLQNPQEELRTTIKDPNAGTRRLRKWQLTMTNSTKLWGVAIAA